MNVYCDAWHQMHQTRLAEMGMGTAFLPVLYIKSKLGILGGIAVIDLIVPDLYRQIALTWRFRLVDAQQLIEIAEMIKTHKKLPEFSVTR